MDDRFIITVIGTQTIDDESDKIEVITSGEYTLSGNKALITYPEFSQENPEVRTDTTVTLDDGRLTIERRGEMSSRLLLEQGVRHQCLYETPMGQMMIGIFTDNITTDLSTNGGSISASYQLDFNHNVVSYNKFDIHIKEKDLG